MPAKISLEPQITHTPLWEQLAPLLQKKHFHQAMLLIGPSYTQGLIFAQRFMAMILCQHINSPCLQCKACHLLQEGLHPDIRYIRQDSQDKAIKIEQIRALLQDAYQTPQCGTTHFIVIEAADRMNLSAANALLKILEEPPAHTGFILLAEQVGSLPATILSRCQRYILPTFFSRNDLTLGELYPLQHPRRTLFEQNALLLTTFSDCIAAKISPCQVAKLWADYSLEDILWYLYLLTSTLIRTQLLGVGKQSDLESKRIDFLANHLPAFHLFKRMEHINTLMRQVKQGIHLNPTLAIEDLLIGYTHIPQ